MAIISPSELILNDRGAVYHLNLLPDELAKTVITVGDPDRVKVVSRYFDKIELISQHREFVTHTGTIGNKRISVLSTGIGPDNIDIVFNELDALVNLDLSTRSVKQQNTSLDIIRIGTAGSLQEYIPVDSFVTSTYGLGLDNLLHFYNYVMAEEDKALLESFITQIQLSGKNIYPYINRGNIHLNNLFVQGFHQGITVTCPGFYGPQGRVLRLGLSLPGFTDRLTAFQFSDHKIANFEMETSAIYGMGKLLGHQCISLSAIVANRVRKEFSKDSSTTIIKLIETTLEKITAS